MPPPNLGVAIIDVILGATASALRTVDIHDGTQFVVLGTLDPAGHVFTPAYGFAAPDVVAAGTDITLPVNAAGVAAALASFVDSSDVDSFVAALIFG